jgi:hypothetical protein
MRLEAEFLTEWTTWTVNDPKENPSTYCGRPWKRSEAEVEDQLIVIKLALIWVCHYSY